MTDWPASQHEEVQGRARGLLIAVAPQLPSVTIGLVDEMIDANECGVALEIMSEMLVESRAIISSQELAMIRELVETMRLDPINVERLRPLVSTTGSGNASS
jgi:hypothetical protein